MTFVSCTVMLSLVEYVVDIHLTNVLLSGVSSYISLSHNIERRSLTTLIASLLYVLIIPSSPHSGDQGCFL